MAAASISVKSPFTTWVAALATVVLALYLSLIANAQQVPCYFIFGDSLVDNGNNNQLQSLARADYLPYGIDFQGGPSGRFSNGKTTVDVIAEQLGFDDYIPPYVEARGQSILRGINYASAAAGIREETGRQLGGRISFSGQVKNYVTTVSQIVELLGDEDSAANHLSQCIYSIGLGSNDYLNNYFMPQFYNTGSQFTPEQYADDLIDKYTQQLQIMYDNGARKFVIIGIGQIGCSPSELAQSSPDGKTCVQRINSANTIFNNKLRALVDQFNGNTPDAKFIYINAYGIFQDLINNPAAFVVTIAHQVPCYFIFGDSLIDNGNNNLIGTLAKANYPPYGIDFPGGPTGRFSNGKTTVDVTAELLGFESYIPPYTTASGEEVLKGVNYASAAAGIREETGRQLGERISFAAQVKNYANTVSQIVRLLGGEESAANHLKKCIFSVGMGSNDYLNNYFMPWFYPTGAQYTPEQFADDLIEQYTEQLKILYNYGARKFVLNGVGQVGCSPNQLASQSPNGKTCVKNVDSAIQIFNKKLRSRVDQLNDKTPDAKLTFIDVFGIFKDLINHPQDYVVVAALLPVVRSAPQQVPCFFIFGDSLNDCGNNNDLDTVAKANYKPYGIDYPGGPTGRFTNGKTIVDFLGDDILRGVNYASGSAGILDDSGSHLGRNVPLGKQVDNHKVTFTKIAAMKGNNESATAHLNTCLYYMGIGSNDYLNNYFVPDHYDSGKRFTVLAFATQLVSVYNEKIRTLYQYGARKIVVVGLGKIGCVPYTMKLFGTNGMNCVESSNSAAKAFNMQLQKLVVRLNLEIKDAKFIFVNTFGMGDGDPKLLGACLSAADTYTKTIISYIDLLIQSQNGAVLQTTVAFAAVGVSQSPEVLCYFIFGDSIFDSGNNNNLATSMKANYLPYGTDFPTGPTGRFNHGQTTADILGN
uniref:Putative GDSL-like lipase acylhydrolase protein n=1 Tax=Linum usitatissimum TaxID=4006 RepID=I6XCV7_LINUS|nr:putative GDSL-like lipase acylhydrolase protein [Linum usitatissimum]